MATNLTFAYAYMVALIEDSGFDVDDAANLAAESYCVDPCDLQGMYADGTEADRSNF